MSRAKWEAQAAYTYTGTAYPLFHTDQVLVFMVEVQLVSLQHQLQGCFQPHKMLPCKPAMILRFLAHYWSTMDQGMAAF